MSQYSTMPVAPTGAQQSTSGWFSNLLNNLVQTGGSIYQSKVAADVQKAEAKAAAEIARVSPQPTAADVAAQQRGRWMPLAIGGGVLALVLVLVLALRGGKRG